MISEICVRAHLQGVELEFLMTNGSPMLPKAGEAPRSMSGPGALVTFPS